MEAYIQFPDDGVTEPISANVGSALLSLPGVVFSKRIYHQSVTP